jgi:hypothetical protein
MIEPILRWGQIIVGELPGGSSSLKNCQEADHLWRIARRQIISGESPGARQRKRKSVASSLDTFFSGYRTKACQV